MAYYRDSSDGIEQESDEFRDVFAEFDFMCFEDNCNFFCPECRNIMNCPDYKDFMDEWKSFYT